MIVIQDEHFSSQKTIMMMLKSYEERHYCYATDRIEDHAKMILGGNNNELFREMLDSSDRLHNPYVSIWHWVKG